MKKRYKKRHRFTLRLKDDIFNALKIISKLEDLTINQTIVKLVKDQIKNYKDI